MYHISYEIGSTGISYKYQSPDLIKASGYQPASHCRILNLGFSMDTQE